jgi:hypothetical protein
MADILIQHCTIRIVRHGGWAWGTEPRDLLNRVLTRLPGMIADEMEELWPDEEEREISVPIRLRIPVSLAELRTVADPVGANPAGRMPDPQLRGSLRTALNQAFAGEADVEARSVVVGDEIIEADHPELTANAGGVSSTDPLSVLVSWLRDGRLQGRLYSFALDALTAWHTHILSTPLTVPTDSAAHTELAEHLAARLNSRPPGIETDLAGTLRLRLQLFAALEATLQGALGSAVIRHTLDRVLPCSALDVAAGDEGDAPPIASTAPRLPAYPASASFPISPLRELPGLAAARPVRTVPKEKRIGCALPFLMLGPLARIGYFEALSAVLAAAGASEMAPFFAVALAYKALDPPARGWSRPLLTREAAATCALMTEAPEDADIASLALAVSSQSSVLDAVVEDVLLAGHRAGTPLLLTPARPAPDDRLVLWDVDGLFPIAITPDPVPVLRRILQEVVLVPADAATPALLSALEAAEIRFVTDAPPCRGERWVPVSIKASERWWSNDSLTAEPRLAIAGGRLADAVELADASWQALAMDRPALPRQTGDTFDTTLTLAAGLALGSIAWELWQDRGPTALPLTLARFRDLEARVRVDAERVSILLPLGRRFFDLRDHAFLDDVQGIPWFGGRLLAFASG